MFSETLFLIEHVVYNNKAHLTAPFEELEPDNEFRQVLNVSAWAIARFIHLIDVEGLFMAKQLAKEAGECGIVFVKTYIWLAHACATTSTNYFRLRPKLHIMHHIPTYFSYISLLSVQANRTLNTNRTPSAHISIANRSPRFPKLTKHAGQQAYLRRLQKKPSLKTLINKCREDY